MFASCGFRFRRHGGRSPRAGFCAVLCADSHEIRNLRSWYFLYGFMPYAARSSHACFCPVPPWHKLGFDVRRHAGTGRTGVAFPHEPGSDPRSPRHGPWPARGRACYGIRVPLRRRRNFLFPVRVAHATGFGTLVLTIRGPHGRTCTATSAGRRPAVRWQVSDSSRGRAAWVSDGCVIGFGETVSR